MVFACAYLAVIVVHTVLYTQSASWTVAGVWSFARMNFVAGALILVATIIGGDWEYVLWGLAVSIFAIIPALVPEDAGWIRISAISSSGTAWSSWWPSASRWSPSGSAPRA